MTDCTMNKSNVQPMSTNLDTQCNQMFKQNIIHNNECNWMLESYLLKEVGVIKCLNNNLCYVYMIHGYVKRIIGTVDHLIPSFEQAFGTFAYIRMWESLPWANSPSKQLYHRHLFARRVAPTNPEKGQTGIKFKNKQRLVGRGGGWRLGENLSNIWFVT